MKQVKVRLGSNSYEVNIGSGLLMQAGHQLKESGFKEKLTIITNPVVKRLYGETLEQGLTREGFRPIILHNYLLAFIAKTVDFTNNFFNNGFHLPYLCLQIGHLS